MLLNHRHLALLLLLVIAVMSMCASSWAQSQVITSYYSPDTKFPEFMGLWHEGWNFKDGNGDRLMYAKPDMPLGGYVHIYYKNTGKKPMKVSDFAVDGIKMSEALGQTFYNGRPDERYQCSILLSKLPKAQIDRLKAVGWPVWWKPEPFEVPAGGIGEIVLRLRRDPKADSVKYAVLTDQGPVNVTTQIKKAAPAFKSISFSSGLDTVYLYPSHTNGKSVKPVKVIMDNQDVTKQSTIVSDPSTLVTPVVIKLQKPLEIMSYHNFRAVYPDGTMATAGIRAWGRDMVYGIWGAAGDVGSSEADARRVVSDWTLHNMNAIMGMYPGTNNPFFFGPEGWKYTESLGVGRMMHWVAEDQTPLFMFIQDEPDAGDANTEQVPTMDRLGTNGQYLVKWANILHKYAPKTPGLLNIDGTYKPENYYMYHQLPDIPCIDPYYQGQIDSVYTNHPYSLPAYSKPTYVYATSTISQSAGAPKPLHVILCSTMDGTKHPNGYQGRYPTPEEKRLEAYYAVAAGAKGLSYWWYTPEGLWGGCGGDSPAAKALWKEIGLLGAEIRTAGPIITASCPVKLPVEASRNLWVRTLLSGPDTAAVIALNDNVLCDRVGTVVNPLKNPRASVKLPTWLKPKDVFEVSSQGIKDVNWKMNGSKLALNLGDIHLSRFVIVTSNQNLRKQMQEEYQTKYAANVKELMK